MKPEIGYLLNKCGLLSALRYYKKSKNLATVLCLHRISDEESAAWPPMKIYDFEKLLTYITRHYTTTTFESLANFNSKKPALILSFDDGFKDFYENGLPLLKKYSLPCNLNVVTKCLDGNFQIWTQQLNDIFDKIWKTKQLVDQTINGYTLKIDNYTKRNINNELLKTFNFLFTKKKDFVNAFLNELQNAIAVDIAPTPMMTWADLQNALNQYDIELGSHSCSHYTLTNITDQECIIQEITQSKQIIEEKTGKVINVFAAPNGRYNEYVISLCKKAGYKHLLTVDEKLIAPQEYSYYNLPRILIAYENHYENILKVECFQNQIKLLLNIN